MAKRQGIPAPFCECPTMRNCNLLGLVIALVGLMAVAGPLGASEPGPEKDRDTRSELARLAASLKSGTWAVLNKDSDDSGYGQKLTDSGIGGLYGYASK